MADTFNNDLRVREQEAGSNSGTWGGLLNTTISNLASAFGQGSEAIPNASTHTITLADGAADEARSMYLKCTGGGQACTVTLAPNTISKVWIISNETSFTLTFNQGSGANVAVAAGAVKMIVTDGAGASGAVTDALSGLAGVFSTLTLGATAITATGTELNLLDGVTATTAELNYVDGVTSAIQTQINTKAPLASPTFTGTATMDGLTVANTAVVAGDFDGGTAATYIRLQDDTDNFLFGSNNSLGNFLIKNETADALRLSVANTGDISFYEDTGTTPKLFWDASAESLGIGTTSPIVAGSGFTGLAIDGTASSITLTNGADQTAYIYNSASEGHLTFEMVGDMRFRPGSAERMRLTSSGSLLLGKSTTGDYVTGIEMQPAGAILSYRNGGVASIFGRTNDGEITRFTRNGSIIGAIGTLSGDLNIGSGDTGLDFSAGLDAIMPYDPSANNLRDNTIGLGQSAARFNDAYITNGVTTGSDANDKQDIETLSDAEQRVAVACKGLLRKWRWKDAVEAKGDDARIHFGIIAQGLQAAFEAEGLDAGRYAMFMSNTWTDEETGEERTRMGVRYSELLAFIISAI